MHISIIAAMSENGIIGSNNKLPWHLPEELKYFKKVTTGKPIIMGRRTFESMGNKPLPNRTNIILSRLPNLSAPGCIVVNSIEEALKVARKTPEMNEVMVIGGAEVYQLFLPLASRLYLTLVHQNFVGDTYFPAITCSDWNLVSEDKQEGFTLKVWDRKIKS